MSASRFPCLECAEPFDSVGAQLEHWMEFGHGPAQVQIDAVDRARYGSMGDDEPELAYEVVDDSYRETEPEVAHALIQRRRFKILPGGKR